MQSWEIHLTDWARILFGNVPPEFFIEVILRVLFIYLLIIFCIRLMGKRMASQLSRNELVAISSLAASIGIPIQTPDRGLLPALLVAVLVVMAQRIVSGRLANHEQFEKKSQGHFTILVEDGCLQLKEMERARISRAEVFARLRSQNVLHLGQVRRMYFEADGDFTVIRHPDGKPGLSVLPMEDAEFRAGQTYSPDRSVCENCGKEKAGDGACGHCAHDHFVPAQV